MIFDISWNFDLSGNVKNNVIRWLWFKRWLKDKRNFDIYAVLHEIVHLVASYELEWKRQKEDNLTCDLDHITCNQLILL